MLTKLPMRLWRRFNIWRATRIYARVIEMKTKGKMLAIEAEILAAKADRLIGRNAKPPMPLFDRLDDSEGGR